VLKLNAIHPTKQEFWVGYSRQDFWRSVATNPLSSDQPFQRSIDHLKGFGGVDNFFAKDIYYK